MDYNSIWFSADHHFCHRNILEYCDRPFRSIEEHDEILAQNWNEVVQPSDHVWYLGDFMMTGKTEKATEKLLELNGKKFLIYGNHDQKGKKSAEWSKVMKEPHVLNIGRYRICLSHHSDFRQRCRKAIKTSHEDCDIYLYGHSHGKGAQISYRIDVGVDNWKYKPVSLQQILDVAYEF